jgi:hypothetical protein
MQLVFIYGPTASGKLTVARELAKLRGYKLFHRHIVEDMVATVLPFGSEHFNRVREHTLMNVFREAVDSNTSLIFTFLPERTVKESFISHTCVVIDRLGGQVVFFELACPDDVIESRLGNADRRAWGKVTDVARYRELKANGAFGYHYLPLTRARIDTSRVSAIDAAKQIDKLLNG